MLAIWEPIIAHVNATWPNTFAAAELQPYPSFNSWFDVFYDQSLAGYDGYVGSRLLDEKALASDDIGESFRLSGGAAYLVAGKGVRDAKPRGGSLSVTPTWRKAIVHAGTFFRYNMTRFFPINTLLFPVNGQEFAPLNATARAEALQIVNKKTEPWRKIAPDMGAYVNEVSEFGSGEHRQRIISRYLVN